MQITDHILLRIRRPEFRVHTKPDPCGNVFDSTETSIPEKTREQT